jgi:hypothetical protein
MKKMFFKAREGVFINQENVLLEIYVGHYSYAVTYSKYCIHKLYVLV